MTNIKKCEFCGEEFETKRKNQKYCSGGHVINCFGCNEEFLLKKPKPGRNPKLYTCGKSKCTVKMRKYSMTKIYGVDNPAKSKDIQKKIQETNLKKYGTKHTFQADKVKKKIKETNLKRYGTENPRWHNKESREKAEKTNLEKYGHVNPFGSEKIKEKIQKINIDKYGTRWTTQAEEVKEKMKESYIRNFGVDNPAKSKIVQNKIKKTNLERYGKESHTQTQEYKDKMTKVMSDKYGVINYSHIGIDNYDDYINLENFLKETDMSINQIANHFKLSRRRIRIKIKELNLIDLFDDYYILSEKETIFEEFLKNDDELKNVKYERNNRTILGGKELDFYFPEHNLAVEISPTATHNVKYGWNGGKSHINSTYHINKFLECEKQGIELLTIFDWHDWNKLLEMIKSKLQGSKRIYARKTTYREENKLSKEIFKKISDWHILSLPMNTKRSTPVSILEYNSEVVGLALWGNIKDGSIELKRMVFKPGINIVGGASKLLKNFLKNNTSIKSVFTFSDCDLGGGSVYKSIGFNLIEESKPMLNYYNEKHNKHIRHLSLAMQGADRLLKNFPGYVPVGMGEGLPSNREIVESYDFLPVYDCGYRKWLLNV